MHTRCLGLAVLVLSFLILYVLPTSGTSADEPSAAIVAPAGTDRSDALALAELMPLSPGSVADGGMIAGQKARALEHFDLSPAIFVENEGQWDAQVRYAFQGKGINVFFTDEGPVFEVLKGSTDGESGIDAAVIRARFVGANKTSPEGLEAASAKMNYYIGSDQSKWRSGVPTFQKICYRNVYDGIDLHVWGRRTGLKYEFHVAPGADWEKIRIEYEGTSGLKLDESGALCVGTPLGEMVDDAPVAYQETASGKVAVECSFRLGPESSYGFEVSAGHDPARALVIDPEIAWGTYLGGNDQDQSIAIAIDASGNAWVTGETRSHDFPTPGGFDTSYGGGVVDAFVAKITSAGELAFATYLGGNDQDQSMAIATDASGNAWVIGMTFSSDFPTPGGFDTSRGGQCDAFVARITPAGSLAFASYLGGSSGDGGHGIAVDASGNAWVTGVTNSSDFPTPGRGDTSYADRGDAFVARITPGGTLDFGRYLGGSSDDEGYDIAVDPSGNAWVTGYTYSWDFPVPGGFDTSRGGQGDAFVAKITPAEELAFASYLGGSNYDWGNAIAIDPSGSAWVTGKTWSDDFPTPGGFRTHSHKSSNAFVARIASTGELAFASYLGGNTLEDANGIAIDASGNAWVTGQTWSSDFPTPGGFDKNLTGIDAFVVTIAPAGTLTFGSYLGGYTTDIGSGIAIDAAGDIWVTGHTSSYDFPTPGGFDTSYNGGTDDAFVAKIYRDASALSVSPSGGLSASGNEGGPFSPSSKDYTLTNTGRNTINYETYSSNYWVSLSSSFGSLAPGASKTVTASINSYADNLPAGRRSATIRFTNFTNGLGDATRPVDLTIAIRPDIETLFLVRNLSVRRDLKKTHADRFLLGASINTAGMSIDWSTVPVTVAVGPYEETLPAGSFATKNGTKYTYQAPKGTTTGIVRALIDLKKRTIYVSAIGLDLSAIGTDVEVTLEADDFESSCVVSITPKYTFGYGKIGQILTDVFMVDKAKFTINTKQANKDSFSISGAMYYTEALDLAAEEFTLTVGGQSWTLPAGSFKKSTKTNLYTYKGPKGSQIRSAKVDLTKGHFEINAAYLSLDPLGDMVVISIDAGSYQGNATIGLKRVGRSCIY